MDSYEYLPLDEETNSFRLLRLRSGDSEPIQCELFHASNSDQPVSYEALSYVWGSTELVEQIEVAGRTLWITENLYSALRCLRSRQDDRVLWIDAVCINQRDKVEQGQQVLRMGQIFGLASQVIFWLGKPTAEATLLMRSLTELQEEHGVSSQADTLIDKATLERIRSSSESRFGPPDSDRRARQQQGLETLLKRSWFERVWILQEVFNARSAMVCSGTFSIPAAVFAISPSLFHHQPPQHVESVLEMMSRNCQVKDSLLDLLTRFHAYKATDQRDMIFALLAMSSDPSRHELLIPDYTRPLLDVVHNAITYWFAQTDAHMDQVMTLLSSFRNIRATYLFLNTKPDGSLGDGTLHGPLSADTRCEKDASLFRLEQYEDGLPGHEITFHLELDRLEAWLEANNATAKLDIQIIPWSREQPNLKLLYVRDLVDALVVLHRGGWVQISGFLADKIVEQGPEMSSGALTAAANLRESGVAQMLVDRGIDVNTPRGPGCSTALRCAGDYDDVEMLRLLITAGARTDANGDYSLAQASRSGHVELVQLMLDAGVDVDAFDKAENNALLVASTEGHAEIVQMLVDRGADIHVEEAGFGTALQAASARGHEQVVQILLDAGADIHAQGGMFGNPLYVAATHSREKTVHLLLDRGADIHGFGGVWGNALQGASALGYEKVVQVLLDRGADVHARGGKYGTALHAAVRFGNDKVVKTLLDRGAAIHTEKGEFDAVLQQASESRYKNPKVVKMMTPYLGTKQGGDN